MGKRKTPYDRGTEFNDVTYNNIYPNNEYSAALSRQPTLIVDLMLKMASKSPVTRSGSSITVTTTYEDINKLLDYIEFMQGNKSWDS